MESSWNLNRIQNPVFKYPRTIDEYSLSSAVETSGFSCSSSCSSLSLNPMTVGKLKMDELQAFPPWILDSLVNVWKALWSSRVLSAIIIRDLSYECWLKKINVTFHSFFFFSFIKENGNWLPPEVERKSWMWYRHRKMMVSSWWITLRIERRGKAGQGPPSANVARMQQNLWKRASTVCTSGPFQFLLYEREDVICSCFGNLCSCPLTGIVSQSHWVILSDTQKGMDILYVLFPTSQPCMDVSHAPGHLTWHWMPMYRQLCQPQNA